MEILLIVVFVLGYFMIAMEHPFKIDKAGSALLTGVLCWLVLMMGLEDMPAFRSGHEPLPADLHEFLNANLMEHLSSIASILFFLIAAMTIVELVDAHDGFRVITERIKTTKLVTLLWIISWVSFFLSAGLDNMTTAIIMCALARKLIKKKETLWLLGGFIVIAANAGGAWSPIGDVTTIMLWIGGHVTTLNIITDTFLASFVSLLVPLILVSWFKKGEHIDLAHESHAEEKLMHTTRFEGNIIFFLGGLGLLFVPVFKFYTGYPPFMGILLSVGVLWYLTEFIHRNSADLELRRSKFSVNAMLHRIDTASILFFLGILLAVAALEESGHLHQLSVQLDQNFGGIYETNTLIGILSSIVDNVPLVAAAMSMYETTYAVDHEFWELLAYCAGTGGSMLIIGSAAGVASMGIIQVDFIWYFKRISLYALVGYFAGILTYALQH